MKSIKQSFVYNALLTGVNLLFPLLSFQYILPILGPAGFGKTQFALSFVQYFWMLAAIGIPVYGVREVARCKNDRKKLSKVFSELIIIHFITSMLLSLAYLAVIFYLGYFYRDQNLYLAGTVSILTGFLSIEWVYNGLSQFRTLALRSLLVKALSLCCIYLLVKSADDYYLFFIITIASGLASNLCNVAMLRGKISFTFNRLHLARHLRPLLLIFSIGLGSSMYTVLDTVLLGFITNDSTVGIYTCAVKFCKLLLPFITTMGVVLMPQMSQKINRDNIADAGPLLQNSFEFIAFLSVPVSFGLYLLAPEVIVFFSGDKFADAVTCMQILAALPFLIGMGYFFSAQILIPGGRDKETLYAVLAGLAIFIGLNFLLVPRLLHNGAAIANVVSEALVTLGYIYYIKKYYTISIKANSLIKSAVICTLFFPIVYSIRLLELPLFIMILTSATACVIIYLALQLYLFKNPILHSLYLWATGRPQNDTDNL